MPHKKSLIDGVTMLLQGVYVVGFDDDRPRLSYHNPSAEPRPQEASRVASPADAREAPPQPQADESIDR